VACEGKSDKKVPFKLFIAGLIKFWLFALT
jgi:hypothetical protein